MTSRFNATLDDEDEFDITTPAGRYEKLLQTEGYTLLHPYRTNKINTLIRHEVCGTEYSPRPNAFNTGKRCPVCANKKRGDMLKRLNNYPTIEEITNKIESLYPFKLLSTEYKDNKTPLKLKRNKCGCINFKRYNDLQQYGCKCTKCFFVLQSKYQERAVILLDNLKIFYRVEFPVSDEKLGKRSADIAILKRIDGKAKCIGIIEIHGEQHYFQNTSSNFSSLESNQANDKLLADILNIKGIPLKIIPYNSNIEDEIVSFLNELGFTI